MVANVAEERRNRDQEGPRCAQMQAKKKSRGLRDVLSKSRGSGPPRGSRILIRKLGESDSEVRSEVKYLTSEVLGI